VDDKAIEKQIDLGSPIGDVDVRYDGRYAAATTDSGVIVIIDLKARARASIDLQAQDIKFAVFSPRGLQIATGSGDGVISMWELGSSNKPFETRKHRGAILTAVFSPNGRFLITGGADGAVMVFDTRTNTEVYRRQHNDQIKDIAFNSDGSWFVSVSNDRSIRMWDTGTGAQLLSMSQNNFVQTVQVSQDNHWIATTGDDKTVRVWSAINGAQLFQMPLKAKGTTLGLSKDGTRIIAGDQNGNIYIWDLTTIAAPATSLQFDGVTASAAYSPNGNRIAASDDRRIWLLNPNSLSPLTTTPPGAPYNELLNNINQIVFGVNGSRIGALTSASDVVIYNLQTSNGKTITPKHPARAFAFSLDERQVIIGNSAGELEVWNAVSGELINTPITFPQRITAMVATSNLLAVGAGSHPTRSD
jgi:WD40 repeat protein